MPRTSAQSDFVIRAEQEVFDQPVALPPGANPVELPRAILRSEEATARATKWTMTYVWIVLALLAVLSAVGPHIPSGE
jgi:hypothetical protein